MKDEWISWMLKGGSEDHASRSSYWTARWRPYKRGMMMRRRGISDRSATTCGSVWRWSRGWGTCIMTMPTRKPSKWQNSVGNCSGRLWKSCPRIYKLTQNNTNVQCWKAYSWKLVCCPRVPYTVSDCELQKSHLAACESSQTWNEYLSTCFEFWLCCMHLIYTCMHVWTIKAWDVCVLVYVSIRVELCTCFLVLNKLFHLGPNQPVHWIYIYMCLNMYNLCHIKRQNEKRKPTGPDKLSSQTFNT